MTIMWRMNIYYQCKRTQPKDIWDYQFCISTQMSGGYTLVPAKNLIRNIGNDERATHTAGTEDTIPVESILPINHPKICQYENSLDIKLSKTRYQNKIRTVYYFIRNIVLHYLMVLNKKIK